MLGPWDSLLELLARGDFDVALNGIEVAEEKKRVCELTRPHYAAAERLTVRRGDARAPHSLAQVKDRQVGTLPGSLAERILRREGAQVKTYEGGQDEIYADLKLGRTDAVLLDEPITRYYGAIVPELEVVPGTFGEVRYAVAVRKGEDTLREALDTALEELARDGTLRRITSGGACGTPRRRSCWATPTRAPGACRSSTRRGGRRWAGCLPSSSA